jgi:hypothetical protein
MLDRAVLVLGAHQGLALAPKSWSLGGLLRGVRMRVHVQYPRLGQQRPHEAEEQQQGNMGAQRGHKCKDARKEIKRGEENLFELLPLITIQGSETFRSLFSITRPLSGSGRTLL